MSEIIEFPEDEIQPHSLTLDPKRWSYQEYADFLQAFARTNWEVVLPLIMKIVVAWTYDVPLGPDAYLALAFPTLNEIATSVSNTLQAYIEGIDVKTVKVNMANWNMQDYFDFRQAGRTGNVEVLEKLLCKVAFVPGVKLGKRLNFEHGTLISRAVNLQTKEMFGTGK